jgi:DNA-directed RNA polymerase subunit RPC12/RpoP
MIELFIVLNKPFYTLQRDPTVEDIEVITLDINLADLYLSKIHDWKSYIFVDYVCKNCGRELHFNRSTMIDYNYCECCGKRLDFNGVSDTIIKSFKNFELANEADNKRNT